MQFTFFSPAKVNLFIKVISKRKDGYHDIASLYQAISLADLLYLKKKAKDSFFCFNNKNLKWDDDNTIKKALNLFREKTKIKDGVEIFLKKNIPIEAGLGGGSSNAATTLWALNELFSKPLNTFELIELSKNIGADVAFFFSLGTAFCFDIGNIFEDVQLTKNFKFFIAKPHFGMCTKKVYENLDLNLLEKKGLLEIKENMFDENFTYFNDLEKSAFALDNRLQETKDVLLKMGFEKVVMTGSGSSFICFGNIKPVKTKKITFFSVFNIQRNQKNWYSF
jgi:4-diphosphocytidyl-2-C-methyl-D-erythritol kinase